MCLRILIITWRHECVGHMARSQFWSVSAIKQQVADASRSRSSMNKTTQLFTSTRFVAHSGHLATNWASH